MDAYFDRISSRNEAVLLVEDTKETLHLPTSILPQNCGPGDWLNIQLDDGKVVSAKKNHKKTVRMQESVEEKLSALRKRKKSSFKRS